MTDEELGKALAEACGLSYQGEWYHTGWDDLTGEATHSQVADLAKSLDTIVRDVFPVLDERFVMEQRWEVSINSEWRGNEKKWYALIWGHDAGRSCDDSPARALAKACLMALTEGKSE